MISSMTGFASATGENAPWSWTWELRSVNGKGLDLRLRVPDWLTGLEAALRADLSKSLTRGSVTLTLKIARDETAGALVLNAGALAAVLDAVSETEAEATRRGISMASSSASDLLALRGVMDAGVPDVDAAPLVSQLKTDATHLIAALVDMRRTEGRALHDVLLQQLAKVEDLSAEAARRAEARKDGVAQTLKNNLARVLENAEGADPDRVAQELALLAVKADVTEEIDRLAAHVTAARDLLTGGGAVGRKFDFLMQEFNREANTLCSKSQSTDLTAIGLELKAVIDQMREQVQNVE